MEKTEGITAGSEEDEMGAAFGAGFAVAGAVGALVVGSVVSPGPTRPQPARTSTAGRRAASLRDRFIQRLLSYAAVIMSAFR